MSIESKKLHQTIRDLWNEDENTYLSSLANLVTEEEKNRIDIFVRKELENEGTPAPHHGTFGLYGKEYLERLRNALALAFGTQIEMYHDSIHKAVCIDSEYCKKRKSKEFQSEGYMVAIYIADALLSAGIGLPFPIATVSIYLAKNKVLDNWCKCKV